MKGINLKTINEMVLAKLDQKIDDLRKDILLKDLVEDELNYYYPVYNLMGEFSHYEELYNKDTLVKTIAINDLNVIL